MVANALSKRRHVIMATLVGTNLWSRILQQLPLDSFYIVVQADIESQRPLEWKFDSFSLEEDGLLRHRGHFYVPRDGALRQDILTKAHRAHY